jgi:lipid-A-disaccharide synthase
MRIFISTGEPSGDLHAANLIEALRARLPEAEFVGFGGPRMKAAGATLLYPLVDLAVMWFLQVFLQIGTFVKLLVQADRYFRDERPDVVVLIDYPGFHWWLARRAKARGLKVVYYVPPQLWAWAGWRVRKVRRFVDLVLCSLPFEPAWYHARGVPGAVHVGHPYFDELAGRPLDPAFLDEQRGRGGPIVAILPGSRTQELIRNVPIMLRAAAIMARDRPGTRFLVGCLKPRHAELFEQLMRQSGLDVPGLEIHQGKTPEVIRLADAAWAVSGSVGLELMAEALPTVVLYKVRPLDLLIARPFIKARFISLVNLLADSEVMPEYLTDRDVSDELARWALRWLADPAERRRASEALRALRDRVAAPGASGRAADRIAALLADHRGGAAPRRGPHRAPASGRLPESRREAGA